MHFHAVKLQEIKMTLDLSVRGPAGPLYSEGPSALWDVDGRSWSTSPSHLAKLGSGLLLLHPSMSHQVVKDLT